MSNSAPALRNRGALQIRPIFGFCFFLGLQCERIPTTKAGNLITRNIEVNKFGVLTSVCDKIERASWETTVCLFDWNAGSENFLTGLSFTYNSSSFIGNGLHRLSNSCLRKMLRERIIL